MEAGAGHARPGGRLSEASRPTAFRLASSAAPASG